MLLLPSSLRLPLFRVISLWLKSYKNHRAHVHYNSHGTAAWTGLLTVFEGGLGLIRIIKKGVTWERKRNPLTMAYNPGFCGQARRGGAGEKGSDFILCGVVLFHKETWRPPSPYRTTPKALLRNTTSWCFFGRCTAYALLVHQPGIKSGPQQWKRRV